MKETSSGASSGCFPALGFKTPSNVPDSLDGWWCDDKTEYAFLGFSYEVSACKCSSSLSSSTVLLRLARDLRRSRISRPVSEHTRQGLREHP